MLLAKSCQHICLPKGEHCSLPEKAIGDLDRNTRAVMADANIPSPPQSWDIVVEHVALLNACTSPSICDPSITIFEADTGVVPWFHRQDASVFATERKSSVQMSNWMSKMNLEYF